MKDFIITTGKKILVLLLVVAVVFISVASYQYLKVVVAPEYNPDTMALNYEVIGSGKKDLILVHGLAGSKNYWKKDLEKITGKYRLLLVDLLGFGDSPKPQSEYTLEVQLEALEKVIDLEGFNKGQSIIIGHSLGAVLTMALFSKHPDWFEGAAVIGLPVFENKDQFIKQMSGDSFFDKLAIGPYGKLFCMLHPIYISNWFKPENLTDKVFSDSKKHTWQSYYYSFNKVILQTDLYKITSNILDRKILFVQGAKDKVAPFANVKSFSSLFRNAKLIEVKDGDHQLYLKDPNIVWKAISVFFDDRPNKIELKNR